MALEDILIELHGLNGANKNRRSLCKSGIGGGRRPPPLSGLFW